jgi:hypothetical protein
MKTSDRSAALIVVPQVVAMDTFYEFVVPGFFLVNSFSQGEQPICGFWILQKICLQVVTMDAFSA